MARWFFRLAMICFLVLASAPAKAPTPEELEEARSYLRNKMQEGQNVARLLAEVVNLYASPDISSASYRLDNGVAFSTLKLPYYRDFTLPDRGWSLFAGINLSYLKATSHNETPLSDQERLAADVTWRGYSGLAEAGARVPLGHGLTLSPSLGAGLAQLRNQTEYLNQFSKENFAPLYQGIAGNFSLDAAQYLAALSLAWRAKLAGLDLACNLRYAHT
ncbi:MAG: autotransporter outer membrane beta-barrel domain-containing protein [Desulfarculus sp.]|nr:autotransporter outer membrane beta-barrel domain-containing protein [Desulfarculus sp.]